jgi:hypothetical protein
MGGGRRAYGLTLNLSESFCISKLTASNIRTTRTPASQLARWFGGNRGYTGPLSRPRNYRTDVSYSLALAGEIDLHGTAGEARLAVDPHLYFGFMLSGRLAFHVDRISDAIFADDGLIRD